MNDKSEEIKDIYIARREYMQEHKLLDLYSKSLDNMCTNLITLKQSSTKLDT